MNPSLAQHTNWIPGLLVLLGGLLFAVGWVLFARRKGAHQTGAVDETLANLDKRASALIEQLRELQQERHHLSEAQYAAEKGRLEKAAADALRAKDAHLGSRAGAAGTASSAAPGAPAAPGAAAPGGFFAQHPQLAGALWGGGVVLFFVVLGLLLSESSHPRGENGVLTGATPPGMQSGATGAQGPMAGGMPPSDPDLEAAIGEARAHPENVGLAAELSHVLIRGQDFETARTLVNRSIGFDPFNTELRVHRAFLRATTGDVAGAKVELTRLAAAYPGASEALLFLGMIALTDDQKPQALEYLERYAAEVPPGEFPPHLADGIQALRQEVAKR
jgi:hypothetical protein